MKTFIAPLHKIICVMQLHYAWLVGAEKNVSRDIIVEVILIMTMTVITIIRSNSSPGGGSGQ